MNTLEEIQNELNELKASFCDDENMLDMLDDLHSQALRHNKAYYDKDDIEALVFSEEDVVDKYIEKGTIDFECLLINDLRDIQHAIVKLSDN